MHRTPQEHLSCKLRATGAGSVSPEVWPHSMTAKLHSNWAGPLSVAWMVGGYLLIRYVTAPRGLQFDPFWLYAATLFCAWLGVGLSIAIVGLRSSSFFGRASAILAIVLFAFFTWHMLYPALKPAHIRGSSGPNQPLQATP